MANAETPEFNGRVILALLNDPKLAELSGQTLITAELAATYGVTEDEDRIIAICWVRRASTILPGLSNPTKGR